MVVTPSPQLHFCATCGLSFEQRGAWEVRQGSMRHFLRTFHETRFENENKRGFARAHMITAHSDSPWAGSSYPLPSLHHDVHLPLKDGCSLPGQCFASFPHLKLRQTEPYLAKKYLTACHRTFTAYNFRARRNSSHVLFVGSSFLPWPGNTLLTLENFCIKTISCSEMIFKEWSSFLPEWPSTRWWSTSLPATK